MSYHNNPKYISKSKINRNELNKMGIPKYISVQEVKDNFDCLEPHIEKVGNPYNEHQQRHTKFVSKHELSKYTIKGYTRQHKRK